MDPVEAEKLGASKMKWLGFVDARVTATGADGGIDIESHSGVAQVKAWARPVGVADVRELRGVAAATPSKMAVFFSTSGYTKKAIDFAQQTDVALFRMSATGSLTAQSRSARRLLDGELSADLKRAFREREAARTKEEELQRDSRANEERQRQQRKREAAINAWARIHASLSEDKAATKLPELLDELAKPDPLDRTSWELIAPPARGSIRDGQTGNKLEPERWPPDVLAAWHRARLDRQRNLEAWALENARSKLARTTARRGYESTEVAAAWDDAREVLRQQGDPLILEQDLEDEKWERISDSGYQIFGGALLGAIGTGALVLISMLATGGNLQEAAVWLVVGLGAVIGAVVAYIVQT